MHNNQRNDLFDRIEMLGKYDCYFGTSAISCDKEDISYRLRGVNKENIATAYKDLL